MMILLAALLIALAPTPKEYPLDGRSAGIRTIAPNAHLHPDDKDIRGRSFYMTQFWISAHGDGEVQIVYGYGQDCRKGATSLTTIIAVKAGTNINWPRNNEPYVVLPTGAKLCIETSTNAFIQGDVWGYWL